jgi:hypothetical protein
MNLKVELTDENLVFLSFAWDDPSYKIYKETIQVQQSLLQLLELIKNDPTILRKTNKKGVHEAKEELEKYFSHLLRKLSESLIQARPENVLSVAEQLEKVEEEFEKILQTMGKVGRYREHYRHQKRTYLIGLILVKQLGLKLLNEKQLKQWYVVACLHDFCYILQEVENITRQLGDKIANTFPGMKFHLEVNSKLGSEYLAEKQKLILASISGHDVEQKEKKEEVDKHYYSLLEAIEDRDHGVMSALFVHDMLFRESSGLSIEEIRDITRAIAFHNNCKHRCSISAKSDPLGCLLILCDELQEWKRPVCGKETKSDEKSVELKNLKISWNDWKAEKTFAKNLFRKKPFTVSKTELLVGSLKFDTEISLEFRNNSKNWEINAIVDASPNPKQKIDSHDLSAFGQKLTSEVNKLAEKMFPLELKKRISELDLCLSLKDNDCRIGGEICLIGKLEKLPASLNIIVFEILMSWLLQLYVNKTEPNRKSMKIQMEKSTGIELTICNSNHEKFEKDTNMSSYIDRKKNNLNRIDTKGIGEYEKIKITAELGAGPISLFPSREWKEQCSSTY